MKDKFPGYYGLTDDEEKELWEGATFVFDACSLLNLYSYSVSARDEVLAILRKIQDRIWIPYQVAAEYQKNRTARIDHEHRNYDETLTKIDKFKKELDEAHRSKRRHPFISDDKFSSLFEQLAAVEDELRTGKTRLKQNLVNDRIRDQLDEILSGRVGDALPSDKLEDIYKEGRTRFKQLVPPGYEDDKDKKEPDKFGDLVIWKETIEYAKQNSKPIVFVTDDEKEDWWRFALKRRQGPRAELIAEFLKGANQQCWLYVSEEFLYRANKYVKPVSEQTVKEVEDVAKENREKTIDLLIDTSIWTHAFDDPKSLQSLLKHSKPDPSKLSEYAWMLNTLDKTYESESLDWERLFKLYLKHLWKQRSSNDEVGSEPEQSDSPDGDDDQSNEDDSEDDKPGN